MASKITDEGSPPSLPRTTGALTRAPHSSSCSVAAARKVSPAPSSTDLPCALSFAASLPIVVVLPLPFTPMVRSTNGLALPKSTGGASLRRSSVHRPRKKLQIAAGSARSRRPSDERISSRSFWLVRTPMSAVSSTFSISDTNAGSTSRLPANRPPKRDTHPARVRARPGANAAASTGLRLAGASGCARLLHRETRSRRGGGPRHGRLAWPARPSWELLSPLALGRSLGRRRRLGSVRRRRRSPVGFRLLLGAPVPRLPRAGPDARLWLDRWAVLRPRPRCLAAGRRARAEWRWPGVGPARQNRTRPRWQ